MIGRAIEMFVTRIWVLVKLTLLFWLLTLSGGVIFGIGPAIKTITELHLIHVWEYREITVKTAYQIWARDFKRANFLFWSFAALTMILAYNLILSVQVRGLLFLIIDFILLFGLTYLLTAYEFALMIDSQFEIDFKNLLKMSFISIFASFFTYLKIFLGTLAIFILTWQFKGLILFGLIGILQAYCLFVTKDWRAKIDEKLAEE